jgi:hypothetical protein
MRGMADKAGAFSRFFKVFRWMIPVLGLLVIFMMLGRPSRPTLPMTAQETREQAQSFDRKLNELAHQEAKEAHFSSDEVSAAYNQPPEREIPAATASGTAGSTTSGATPAAGGGTNAPELTPQTEVPENTPVHDISVDFHGDEFTGQAAVNVHGKDVYITISGHLGSKDGYVTVDLTSAKIGNLVVPVSVLSPLLQKKMAEPGTREQFKLPDVVRSLRIENGELVLEAKN